VGGSQRPYSTWLPKDYDPTRGYPVILLLHGCGSGTNNLPMEHQTGADAVLIRGTGSGADTCWNDNADLPFIDAMVEDVQARFCTDTSRFFAVGYSSGSWVASLLSCIRADVFRGIATVAGGENSRPGECRGPVARMFFNDVGDPYNLIEWARPGRDRMLDTNECDDPPASDPVDPAPCVSYRGCSSGYPVVWCETTGHGHGRRDDVAAPAFWNFFQGLQPQP
jgi:poly(3-hydroxybutyrate) depolymerase